MTKIAIVGSGFSGTMTAVHLVRESHSPTEIFLIEKTRFAAGAAYGTSDHDHLLNVRTSKMGAFPEDPGHFQAWLEQNKMKWSAQFPDFAIDPDGFAPRALYSVYLRALLDHAIDSKTAAVRIDCLKEEAIDLKDAGDRRIVAFKSGGSLAVDAVVLAMGNMRPSQAAFADAKDLRERCIDNLWADSGWMRIHPSSDILIIGSGLTMADVVISLSKRDFTGKITVLSRRGLLPQEHASAAPFRLSDLPADRSPRSLFRWLRLETARAEKGNGNWRAVVDALRPATQDLWRQWTSRQKDQFFRHLRHLWDSHRHRMPGPVAAKLKRLEDAGRLRRIAARIVEVSRKGDKIELTYQLRGSRVSHAITADYVINCCGPESDFRRLDDPLVRALLNKGICSIDELGLGIRTDDAGLVLDRDHKPVPFLFALGPLRKGTLWESTAVPEIREQARDLARRLLRK